ncbi:MAG: DUF2782 domain-containing protein [Wenzhouxiangellaceae bacterium]
MNLRFLQGVGLAALLIAGTVAAQQGREPAREDAPPPPPIREPLPPKVTDPDNQIEPQVRIRREQDRTIEEYVTSSGQVYMVRVQPVGGPAYYMIDTTGDGILNIKHDRFEPVKPVYWKIFEW